MYYIITYIYIYIYIHIHISHDVYIYTCFCFLILLIVLRHARVEVPVHAAALVGATDLGAGPVRRRPHAADRGHFVRHLLVAPTVGPLKAMETIGKTWEKVGKYGKMLESVGNYRKYWGNYGKI